MTDREQNILRFLRLYCNGQGFPVSTAKLADYCHCHERRIRESVHDLRRQGIPICSTEKGYYWPVSREDALPAMRHLTSLFQPLRESYTGFMNGLDEMFEPNLFDQEVM